MTVPRFLVEDIGDITDFVAIDQCVLNTAAQGDPSMSTLFVKDVGPAMSFVTGKRVTVDVGGTAIWAGYIAHIGRRFWFDVDIPANLQRQWALTLVDVSILFSRRVVFKNGDPEHVQGPVYASQTYDDTALTELFANWLDLSADDIDLTTRVDQVGIINPSGAGCAGGYPFYPWNGGMTWGETMQTIARLPAAVYALVPGEPLGTSPFVRLVYADVDEEDAPFELSDNPVPASGHVGYSDCTIWDDGTELVNDTLMWGAGKGVNHKVFDRREDATSIAAHGRWQSADLLSNVWCQDTIDKITDSIINGSPQSKRGQKDDIRSVELTVYEPGLVVGQRVHFINEEYGIDQVLPIRRSEIEFPTGTAPQYKLLLSHAVDSALVIKDKTPRTTYDDDPELIPPMRDAFQEDVIDIFERVESGAWGTPTRGTPDWITYSTAKSEPLTTIEIGVSEIPPLTGWGRIIFNLARRVTPNSTTSASATMRLNIPEIVDWDEFTLQFDAAVAPAHTRQGIAFLQIRIGGSSSAPGYPQIDLPLQFEHFISGTDHLDWFLARDALAGLGANSSNTHNELIANVSSFDGTITIDRSVSRGTTLVTVGDLGTTVFTPARTVSGNPNRYLTISYNDYHDSSTLDLASTCSIDNLVLIQYSDAPSIEAGRTHCETPFQSTDTLFTTVYGIQSGSLQVWRNGLAQANGTDFTELGANEFEFNETVDDTEPVYACYLPV